MVIHLGNHQSNQETSQGNLKLPHHIVGSIPILKLCRIGAGAVDHHQAECHQKYDAKQQTVVIEPFGLVALRQMPPLLSHHRFFTHSLKILPLCS